MTTIQPLLELTPRGLYCRDADVYLDPWAGVPRALITHAHSDHARPGSDRYLTHHRSVPVLHARLGTAAEQVQGIGYAEVVAVNGVKFSFHPAGHVPGSSQILVERRGERWVFSGDYKLEHDGLSDPFEAVPCDVFISECTFGLPVFRWQPQEGVFAEITSWWQRNQAQNVSSIVCVYSLGKAQRVLKHLLETGAPIFVHTAIWNMCELLGMTWPGVCRVTNDTRVEGACVLAPPAVIGTPWLKRFGAHEVAVASGWMAIRGIKRRRGVARGFVLSDHADFASLNKAVRATGAEKVLLTHGYTAAFARWLSDSGLNAKELKTEYSANDGELES